MTVDLLDSIAESLAIGTAVEVTQKMVRTDSTCGAEARLARQLEDDLKALGIGRVWCEEVFEDRLNTLWEIDSGKEGPHLLFTGHLDTKPVCEGWTRDPFEFARTDQSPRVSRENDFEQASRIIGGWARFIVMIIIGEKIITDALIDDSIQRMLESAGK